jgi:hypothetical protein
MIDCARPQHLELGLAQGFRRSVATESIIKVIHEVRRGAVIYVPERPDNLMTACPQECPHQANQAFS